VILCLAFVAGVGFGVRYYLKNIRGRKPQLVDTSVNISNMDDGDKSMVGINWWNQIHFLLILLFINYYLSMCEFF